MKRSLLSIAAVCLTACTTTAPTADGTVAAQDNSMVCEMTFLTGSAVPKRRCETPEEKERQRKLAQETAGVLSKAVIIQEKPGGLK